MITSNKLKALIIASLFSFGLGIFVLNYINNAKLTPIESAAKKITKEYKVRRYFSGDTWATYWKHCGGYFTADHVVEDIGKPKFTKYAALRTNYMADIAFHGKKYKCKSQRDIKVGEKVYLLGYPAGADKPTIRVGNIYLKRTVNQSLLYAKPTYIALFSSETNEPVVGGMSGGVVTDMDYNAIAVIVAQNSPTDLNNDGVLDNSADIVSLTDFHDIYG